MEFHQVHSNIPRKIIENSTEIFTAKANFACAVKISVEFSMIFTCFHLGGRFSGSGVNGSDFFPALAGQGVHLISYFYTDPITGCSNIYSRNVSVLPACRTNVL